MNTGNAELDRLVEEQARDLEYLYKVDQNAYMASALLWSLPPGAVDELGRPRPDQRSSVEATLRAPCTSVVLGGERSGKSRGHRELLFATALGSDHPHVGYWLEHNRLVDAGRRIQPGPTQVYAVARDSGSSVRYHRPEFARMARGLPHRWVNANHKGEGLLEIKVPGTRDAARIWFLSIEQGPDPMQGISLGAAWIDEEPWTPKGRAVYKHLRGRVADQDGWVAITMVPVLGYTWVHDDLIRDRQDDAVVTELDSLDNPHLPAERMVRHFGGMSDEERDMRRFGRFRAASSSIYPLWSPGIDGDRYGTGHVCDPFDIPRDWPRFRCGDFGLENATALGWFAIGDDDTAYFYSELYMESVGSFDVAANQAMLHNPEPVSGSWGDPSALAAREAFAAAGMPFDKANNDLAAGYSCVRERLRLRDDERPRLKVFRTCPNIIRSLGGLRRDPKRIDLVQLRVDDHAADMVRYGLVGYEEWRESSGYLEAHMAAVSGLLARGGVRRWK